MRHSHNSFSQKGCSPLPARRRKQHAEPANELFFSPPVAVGWNERDWAGEEKLSAAARIASKCSFGRSRSERWPRARLGKCARNVESDEQMLESKWDFFIMQSEGAYCARRALQLRSGTCQKPPFFSRFSFLSMRNCNQLNGFHFRQSDRIVRTETKPPIARRPGTAMHSRNEKSEK